MLFLKLHRLRAGSPTGKTSKHSVKLFSKWTPLKIGPNCHKSIHLSSPSMDFEGRTVTFREGILSTSSVLFFENQHLKRGTIFEMLARKYPEILHTMMWRRMVCRSLKFFPIWIRSIQIADMHLWQKTIFLTKDYFTVSWKPQPPHPHPICCLHKFWWDSLFSTPQLATHNDWKASKHWNSPLLPVLRGVLG